MQKAQRRKSRKERQEGGGFLSYLFQEEESREDSHNSWQGSNSQIQSEKREESFASIRRNSDGSNPSEPKAKSRKFWKRNKRQSQDESNAWEWGIDPVFIGGLNEKKEKKERRVRFAKFNSSKAAKDDGPDYGQRLRESTEIAAIELQKGQQSLLDWIGITDEETPIADESVSRDKDSNDNAQRKTSPLALPTANQPASPPPPENSTFHFVGLLNNWGEMSSSEEGSSLASTLESTQGSGTVTSTEEASMFTDDDEEDSKYTATDQSEISTLNPESEEDYNEVVLAFKPAPREENAVNLLPVLEEESSVELEKHVYADNPTNSYVEERQGEMQESLEGKERIEDINSILEELEEFNELRAATKDLHESADLKPSSLARRGIMCRSVKSLNCQQLKWSVESGLPFHELSQTELAAIFPKVRSVTDNHEGVGSELIKNSDAFAVKVPVHLQAALQHSGPQSLFEYEYETGVHMFVSYYEFGEDVRNMKVETAPTPPLRIRKRSSSLNKTMIQVEVRGSVLYVVLFKSNSF